jgi:hypothetical protein
MLELSGMAAGGWFRGWRGLSSLWGWSGFLKYAFNRLYQEVLMQDLIEAKKSKRWLLLRSSGVFLLTIFGILALRTEVVDVAKGYLDLDISAKEGLNIVVNVFYLVLAFTIGIEFIKQEEHIILVLRDIYIIVGIPISLSTLFYVGHFDIQINVSDSQRALFRGIYFYFAIAVIVWEAYSVAARYYKNAMKD